MIMKYPYTDYNEYNLDWCITRIRDLTYEWVATHQEWEDTKTEWENYKNYIDNYFANLDVSAEINAKLDAMALDGSLTEIIRPIFDDAIAEVPGVVSDWIADNLMQETGYVIDASLTVANAAADAEATGAEINNLASVTVDNLLDQFTKTDRLAAAGIDFEWNNNRCYIHGTATGNTFANIFSSANTLPAGVVPGGIYYVRNVGGTNSAFRIYYYDANNALVSWVNTYDTYQNDYAKLPADAHGMVIRMYVANGTTVNETVYPLFSKEAPGETLTQRTFRDWLYENPVYIREVAGGGYRNSDISAALNAHKHVVLGPGTFPINNALTIPAGCILEGCGEQTIIEAHGTNVTSIVMSAYSRIKNILLDGGEASAPGTEGSRYGIYASGITDPFYIEGCSVTGFSKNGIYIASTSGNTVPFYVSDCYITACYNGLYVHEAEYGKIERVTCRECYRGLYENGGNNKYSDCGFDSNEIGVQMTTLYANNGHGSFTGCSINHNTQYALYCGSLTNGELFTGCQIHFGTIHMAGTTRGVNFSGCQFGQSIAFNNASGGDNYLIGCTFYADPTFTNSGAGTLSTINCYNFVSGSPVINS